MGLLLYDEERSRRLETYCVSAIAPFASISFDACCGYMGADVAPEQMCISDSSSGLTTWTCIMTSVRAFPFPEGGTLRRGYDFCFSISFSCPMLPYTFVVTVLRVV